MVVEMVARDENQLECGWSTWVGWSKLSNSNQSIKMLEKIVQSVEICLIGVYGNDLCLVHASKLSPSLACPAKIWDISQDSDCLLLLICTIIHTIFLRQTNNLHFINKSGEKKEIFFFPLFCKKSAFQKKDSLRKKKHILHKWVVKRNNFSNFQNHSAKRVISPFLM